MNKQMLILVLMILTLCRCGLYRSELPQSIPENELPVCYLDVVSVKKDMVNNRVIFYFDQNTNFFYDSFYTRYTEVYDKHVNFKIANYINGLNTDDYYYSAGDRILFKQEYSIPTEVFFNCNKPIYERNRVSDGELFSDDWHYYTVRKAYIRTKRVIIESE